MENNYTSEQIKDITTREKEALAMLKTFEVSPAAIIQKVRMQTSDGGEVFVDQLTPYLQDTKYVRKSNGSYEDRIKVTEKDATKTV